MQRVEEVNITFRSMTNAKALIAAVDMYLAG